MPPVKGSSLRQKKVVPEAFELLLKELQKADAQIEVKSDRAAALFKDTKFPALGLGLAYSVGEGLIRAGGSTFDFKESLKGLGFRWLGGQWVARLSGLDFAKTEKFLETLRTREAERAEQKSQKLNTPKVPQRKENLKPGYCTVCRAMVPAGEGWLSGFFDDDEEKWVYTVSHKDSSVCSRILEEVRAREQLAKTKRDAQRNLALLCVKRDHYVEGERLHPPGELIYIDDTGLLYGGGSWIVVEPDGEHLWYVKNNGSDGDMWANNNVATGGAGALGYRVKVTPEVRALAEVSVGREIKWGTSYDYR
jgi:hypothetical protein